MYMNWLTKNIINETTVTRLDKIKYVPTTLQFNADQAKGIL